MNGERTPKRWEISENLKELRTQNNLTQKQLAKMAQISVSVLSGYELGERTPSVEVLVRFAEIFHTSVDTLLGLKPIPQSAIISTDGLTEEQVRALLALVKSMKRNES